MKVNLKSNFAFALVLLSSFSLLTPVEAEPVITIKSSRPPGLDRFENLSGPHPARSMGDIDKDITLHPNAAAGYIHRGAAWMLEGDAENAQRDFAKALQLDPHSAQAHIGLSRVYTAAQKWNSTFAELHKAEELGSPETALNALNESAFLHRELKQYDIAIKEYSTVIAAKSMPKSQRTYSLLQRGQTYGRTGKYQEAIRDYNQVVTLDPTVIEARVSRAHAYLTLKQLPQAVADCTFVIDLEKKKFPAELLGGIQSHLLQMYTERATAYEQMGKHDLALRDRQSARVYERQTLEAVPFRTVPIKQH
jgi:tetratricopeptide (TPR) repeat protein